MLGSLKAHSGRDVEHGLKRVMTEMQGDQSGWPCGPPRRMLGGKWQWDRKKQMLSEAVLEASSPDSGDKLALLLKENEAPRFLL